MATLDSIPDEMDIDDAAEILGLDKDYMIEFFGGFDSYGHNNRPEFASASWLDGWDGAAAVFDTVAL